jgi:hypothetical protein
LNRTSFYLFTLFPDSTNARKTANKLTSCPTHNRVVRTDNTGATYIGRGGTGNLVKPVIPGVDPEDGAALAKAQSAVSTSSAKSDDKDTKSPSPAAGDADEKRRRSSDAKNGPGLVEKGLNKLFGKK